MKRNKKKSTVKIEYKDSKTILKWYQLTEFEILLVFLVFISILFLGAVFFELEELKKAKEILFTVKSMSIYLCSVSLIIFYVFFLKKYNHLILSNDRITYKRGYLFRVSSSLSAKSLVKVELNKELQFDMDSPTAYNTVLIITGKTKKIRIKILNKMDAQSVRSALKSKYGV